MSTHSGKVLVAGGGGFIGGWMTSTLASSGAAVRAVDIKPSHEWFQRCQNVENLNLDLRSLEACRVAVDNATTVFNFACDMGGMGFIETHKADCMLSVLINTHLLQAAKESGVERYFFASSACVYNVRKQASSAVVALREDDAYPAMPEDGYGWEKLFSERMCRAFADEFGLETRVARYHNVFGPDGTWDGGREKAPAAICRKVIEAKLSGSHKIQIWGDGEQTRTFTYIDDCLRGTRLLMESNERNPINIGSGQLISINKLVDIVESIAGIKLERHYILDAPQGVRGRSSDNSRIKAVLGWEPSISLEEGLERTYQWIFDQISGN